MIVKSHAIGISNGQTYQLTAYDLENMTGYTELPDHVIGRVWCRFDQIHPSRPCLRCGDTLEVNDDLICGYHQLES